MARRSSKESATVQSVRGFHHFPDVLSADEQSRLVGLIDAAQRWEPDFSRERQSHAYTYKYKIDKLERIGDAQLPDWLTVWAEFIYRRNWMSAPAQQVTVQKYGVDSYIGPHIDSPKCFPNEIVTFSLVSSCEFRLTNARTGEMLSRELNAGDVVMIQHDARDLWKHEVRKREKDHEPARKEADWRRLSVTFRAINPERVLP